MPQLSEKPRRALVFDLDGTLVDSAPDLHVAVNCVLSENNRKIVTVDDVKFMIGDGVKVLMDRAFRATGVGIPEEELGVYACRFLDFYEGHDADLSTVYPGVIDTLEILRDAGYAMGVCTNKPQRASDEVLEKLGLRSFFTTVIGGDVQEAWRKPDPRHLEATLKAMGADKTNAVMIGDHQNDVDTANGLGVPSVAVSYGYARLPVTELGASVVIDSFAELPAILAKLP